MYRLKFTPDALAEWKALDGAVKEPLRKLLKKRLENPLIPANALRGTLSGYYKIKLLQQGYRLVYTVSNDALVVLVVTINQRDKNLVYQQLQKLIG
jgi:mRNA interferase RelE/StbE